MVYSPLLFYLGAQRAVRELVDEHKVDVIVAVTHVSLPQDKELAAKVPEIDVHFQLRL